MFLNYLSMLAGTAVFMGAFFEGRRGGILGTLIGVALGLIGGSLVFATTQKSMKWLIMRYGLYKAQLSPGRLICVWCLIAMLFVWAVFASIIFSWTTKVLIHQIR